MPVKYNADYLTEAILNLAKDFKSYSPECCGISVPGLADAKNGKWLYAPFSGISDFSIAEKKYINNNRKTWRLKMNAEKDGKKFFHTLRYQIPVNHYEEERINDLVEYCKKYGFSDVTLFLSAEECNVGHITLEEAKPRVAWMKKAAERLRANGISVSLNPWMEIGHLDRNKPLKGLQNEWTLLVDYNGRRSQSCACMLDEKWRAYFKELYSYVVDELQPNIVWVEDDFRLHNHAPLEYGGCFCEKHMKLYNERLGTNYTREEFVDKLFKKECNLEVKRAWMDVNREVMSEYASFLGELYRSHGGGNVRVGLMSSRHSDHAVEYRDWFAVHKNLSGGAAPINRLHMPCYEERCSKDYYRDFYMYPFFLRSMLPENCIIYPEQEDSTFNSYGKEPAFLRFQLEGALPLQIEGMTYDIFSFVGNGPKENIEYCETIKNVTPYLEGVMPLIKYSELDGVMLPMDERAAYRRENCRTFSDFYPDEHFFYGYLGTSGVPCKPTTQKEWQNEVVALGNGAVNNFTDEQLKALFKNNKVLLDGGAVMLLIKRGLGDLVCARSAVRCKYEYDPQSQEEVVGDVIIDGIKGYRASTYLRCGDYIKIEYDGVAFDQNGLSVSNDELSVKTVVLDYKGDNFGIGIVSAKNFMVIPYWYEERTLSEQFNRLRMHFLKEFLENSGKPMVCSNYPGVYAYMYKHNGSRVLFLVNGTVSSFESPRLRVSGFKVNSAEVVDRTTGEIRGISCSEGSGNLKLGVSLPALSTAAIILK